MKRPLAEVAHEVAMPLAWMDAGLPLRQIHQQTCVCAACEVTTQRVRLLDAVNSGQYEENE